MRRKIVRPPDPDPLIPRPLRLQCSRITCEACGATYGKIQRLRGTWRYATENLDHIFPRRYLIQFNLKPHVAVNLLSACGPCHGVKKRSENKLFAGDCLGYVAEVIKAGWPAERVKDAALHFAFKEVAFLINRRFGCGSNPKGVPPQLPASTSKTNRRDKALLVPGEQGKSSSPNSRLVPPTPIRSPKGLRK